MNAINLWSAAGYEIEDAGEFVPCAAKVIGSVRFHITDLDGTGVPHPDTDCMVMAFDAEDHQYLDLSRDFPNRAALELALPDLAAEAAGNRAMLNVDQLQDYVCSHGYGEATAEGLALAQSLFAAGDDVSTVAAEIAARGLTTESE